MADADKERVAKVKASLPPVPKQAKQAKPSSNTKAEKASRAKSAYLVSSMQRLLSCPALCLEVQHIILDLFCFSCTECVTQMCEYSPGEIRTE